MINWSCLSLGLPGNCEKQELLVFTVFTWFFQVFDSNYRGSFDPKNPFRDHIPDELPIPQMVKHLPGPQTCGHFLWKTMVFRLGGVKNIRGMGVFSALLDIFFTVLCEAYGNILKVVAGMKLVTIIKCIPGWYSWEFPIASPTGDIPDITVVFSVVKNATS